MKLYYKYNVHQLKISSEYIAFSTKNFEGVEGGEIKFLVHNFKIAVLHK